MDVDSDSTSSTEHLFFIDNLPLYKTEKPYMCAIPLRHVQLPSTNIQKSLREVKMRNMRGRESLFQLDTHGFEVKNWPTQVPCETYQDHEAIVNTYYPECEAYLKSLGIGKVFIFDHVVRKAATSFKSAGISRPQRELPPARGAHIDQTASSAIRRVRHHLPTEADKLYQGRVQLLNVWRPLFSGLKDHPLALCDYQSTSEADLLATDLPSPSYVGEMYYVKHNPAQRWWFLDAMNHNEVFIIKCFDSEAEEAGSKIARFTPHTSFEWSGTPSGARPRESIEVRALCFS